MASWSIRSTCSSICCGAAPARTRRSQPGRDFDAQAAEVDAQAPAIDFAPGDQLVFRYTGSSDSPADSYIPNGDGAKKQGRDPNITLPP
jgi:hypothetical protein